MIFCPTPKHYDCEQLCSSFKEFFVELSLRAYFGLCEFQTDIIHILNNKQSTKTSITSDLTIETFIAAVSKDIENKPQPFDNLTQGERKALESLSRSLAN